MTNTQTDTNAGLTRLSVNLNAETADALRRLHADTGLSYTELLRRAIGLQAHLETEQAAGRRLFIANRRGYPIKEFSLV